MQLEPPVLLIDRSYEYFRLEISNLIHLAKEKNSLFPDHYS